MTAPAAFAPHLPQLTPAQRVETIEAEACHARVARGVYLTTWERDAMQAIAKLERPLTQIEESLLAMLERKILG